MITNTEILLKQATLDVSDPKALTLKQLQESKNKQINIISSTILVLEDGSIAIKPNPDTGKNESVDILPYIAFEALYKIPAREIGILANQIEGLFLGDILNSFFANAVKHKRGMFIDMENPLNAYMIANLQEIEELIKTDIEANSPIPIN